MTRKIVSTAKLGQEDFTARLRFPYLVQSVIDGPGLINETLRMLDSFLFMTGDLSWDGDGDTIPASHKVDGNIVLMMVAPATDSIWAGYLVDDLAVYNALEKRYMRVPPHPGMILYIRNEYGGTHGTNNGLLAYTGTTTPKWKRIVADSNVVVATNDSAMTNTQSDVDTLNSTISSLYTRLRTAGVIWKRD